MTSGDPILGVAVKPSVRGRASTFGVLIVGMWQASPHELGGLCRLHVDLFGPRVFVPFGTNAMGQWDGALRTTGGYSGFSYAMQAALIDYAKTGAVSLTNGVVLRAGTR